MKAYLITFKGGITKKVYRPEKDAWDIIDTEDGILDNAIIGCGATDAIYFTRDILCIEPVEE